MELDVGGVVKICLAAIRKEGNGRVERHNHKHGRNHTHRQADGTTRQGSFGGQWPSCKAIVVPFPDPAHGTPQNKNQSQLTFVLCGNYVGGKVLKGWPFPGTAESPNTKPSAPAR